MSSTNWGGYRDNAGRNPKAKDEKKLGYKVYFSPTVSEQIEIYSDEDNFSKKVNELVLCEINRRKDKVVRFIDLFAGLGGIRIGLEQAVQEMGYKTECVLTSEIKPHAIKALEHNFKENQNRVGDITKVKTEDIPDFDILLAGFPCQAFSTAGKGHGFLDTRGTLFFEVERILRDKEPNGFILENVEGLVLHDREGKNDKIGRTLKTILKSLKDLGYKVSYKVLDSKDFGLPQSRKRIYIVGTKNKKVQLDNFKNEEKVFRDIREYNKPVLNTFFTKKLLQHYIPEELYGKAVKDKRGGQNNIHSWDIGLKGDISEEQRNLLSNILLKRRQKSWADEVGIDWMDGMPLTFEQISSFYSDINLNEMLEDLVDKGYLKKEYPKKKVKTESQDGLQKTERIQDETKEKGYNIVSGKLSFEFTKFIDDNDITPTIVAMDASRLGVIEENGVRQLTIREGLRLFGYPEDYSLDFYKNDINKAYDLLGNTVTIPVVKQVAEKLFDCLEL